MANTSRNNPRTRRNRGNTPRYQTNPSQTGSQNQMDFGDDDYYYTAYGYYPSDSYQTSPTWVYEEYWWETPGPYTGFGPRGYVRSDEDIQQDVCSRLAANGQLDASNIEVQVNNHEVTLKGDVDSRSDKRLAEDIADTVFGVDDIHNQLHVNKNKQMTQSQTLGTGKPNNLFQGESVVGSMGKSLGTVKEIHARDFVLDRPMQKDLHVPFTAIQDTNGNQVRLNLTSDQLDNQGWSHLA